MLLLINCSSSYYVYNHCKICNCFITICYFDDYIGLSPFIIITCIDNNIIILAIGKQLYTYIDAARK